MGCQVAMWVSQTMMILCYIIKMTWYSHPNDYHTHDGDILSEIDAKGTPNHLHKIIELSHNSNPSGSVEAAEEISNSKRYNLRERGQSQLLWMNSLQWICKINRPSVREALKDEKGASETEAPNGEAHTPENMKCYDNVLQPKHKGVIYAKFV